MGRSTRWGSNKWQLSACGRLSRARRDQVRALCCSKSARVCRTVSFHSGCARRNLISSEIRSCCFVDGSLQPRRSARRASRSRPPRRRSLPLSHRWSRPSCVRPAATCRREDRERCCRKCSSQLHCRLPDDSGARSVYEIPNGVLVLAPSGEWMQAYLAKRGVTWEELLEAAPVLEDLRGLLQRPFFLSHTVDLYDADELGETADMLALVGRFIDAALREIEEESAVRCTAPLADGS